MDMSWAQRSLNVAVRDPERALCSKVRRLRAAISLELSNPNSLALGAWSQVRRGALPDIARFVDEGTLT